MRSGMMAGIGVVTLGMAFLVTPAASAQSSASTYSYGTYNPVQAAINRNTMNAAIRRQATGAHARKGTNLERTAARHRR